MRGLVCLAALLASSVPAMAAKPAKPPMINLQPARPDEKIGDWTVIGGSSDVVITSVGNNAGSVFGVVCSHRMTEGCAAFLNPSIECDDGHKYAALVNAPAAAFAVTLVCEKIDDMFLYTLPLEGGVADAMSVGGVLGIAFPMQSGQFKVARFSLTGAARAAARAAQLAAGEPPIQKQDASDNSTL
jgi:hypothetical protein